MAIKQRSKSLKVTENALSNPYFQLNVLNNIDLEGKSIASFKNTLSKHGYTALLPTKLEIFQLNIGKLCNQSCAHCHVDAGPDQTEQNMSKDTLIKCLEVIEKHHIPTVDITGGAPEMNPHYRWFVESCVKLGKKVLTRCNLTIIEANPKYHDLPDFFVRHGVEVISSLPYFSKLRTDKQRGDGVFEDSILALKKLNDVGYGIKDSGLILNLVYNPTGAFLPGDQENLQDEFKRQLLRRYGIHFNQLFVITNLPVSRFLDYLLKSGNYSQYMTELYEAFNPSTVKGLMCKNTLSVSWDGYLYDCDFNQMLDLKLDISANHIDHFDIAQWHKRKIIVDQHCYGCTAGAGSSCSGEIDIHEHVNV